MWDRGLPDKIDLPEFAKQLAEIMSIHERKDISSLHLYLESKLEEMIESQFGKVKAGKIIGERTNLMERAKILYAIGVIDDNMFHNIRIISNLRNKYSHQMKPDQKKLNELYSSFRHSKVYEKANAEHGLNSTSDKVLFFALEIGKLSEQMKSKSQK